jgi:hypothetical protein
MNNIHEKDWAEGCWSGHTGMDSFSDDCLTSDRTNEEPPGLTREETLQKSGTKEP